MKSITITISILFFIFSCGSNEITENNYTDLIDMENPPVMSFDNTEFDFGTLIEGEKVEHTFHFTNTGKGTLVISSVNASCGCTVAKDWPRTPIKPGEKGSINVIFDSEGKVGNNPRNLSVLANTQPTENYLRLMGTVIGPTK